MKFFSYFTRSRDEPTDTNDQTCLIGQNGNGNNKVDDDDDQSNGTDENDTGDKDEGGDFCDSCGREETVYVDSGESCAEIQGLGSSVEVVEVIVVEEQTDKKAKRKKLRKRVRKRVWRVVRSSWKYFRRGMSAYSPGLASMFTWGINFQQGVPRTQRPSGTRYF